MPGGIALNRSRAAALLSVIGLWMRVNALRIGRVSKNSLLSLGRGLSNKGAVVAVNMRRWPILMGLALGFIVALYMLFWPNYQTPLGLEVEVREVEPLKYRVFFELVEGRYEPSNQPAVIIILPSARELGVPPMRNIQLSAVGPTVGEVWLDDAEVRGDTVVVRLDGKFGKVLDDWLRYLGNATGMEPSIHIHIWYGDEYLGFAAVNYDPHKLAKKDTTYVVKARVTTVEIRRVR